MGQKINPIGFRVGVIRDWDTKWYAKKDDYAKQLHEDLRIRDYIEKNLKDAAIDRVVIERTTNNRIDVSIYTARPGVIIGKGGADVEVLRNKLQGLTDKTAGKTKQIQINIVEMRKPDLNAHLVGMQIASDLERRVAFRRAMRGAIQRAMRAGAKGIKVMVSGRLNGADIARVEQYTEGTVPLHTLRADIDYSWDEAMTAYGNLGIKTWIYRGDVESGEKVKEDVLEPGERSENSRGNGRPRRNNNGGGNRNQAQRNSSNNNNAATAEKPADTAKAPEVEVAPVVESEAVVNENEQGGDE